MSFSGRSALPPARRVPAGAAARRRGSASSGRPGRSARRSRALTASTVSGQDQAAAKGRAYAITRTSGDRAARARPPPPCFARGSAMGEVAWVVVNASRVLRQLRRHARHRRASPAERRPRSRGHPRSSAIENVKVGGRDVDRRTSQDAGQPAAGGAGHESQSVGVPTRRARVLAAASEPAREGHQLGDAGLDLRFARGDIRARPRRSTELATRSTVSSRPAHWERPAE